MEEDGAEQLVEEQSKLNTALKNIRSRTKDLLLAVQQLERQRQVAPGKWLASSEQIARQFRTLSDQIVPMLDHWVFLPQESSDRLPDLLRTKLGPEQEKREEELLKSLPEQVGESDEFQKKQSKANESCGKLLEMIAENKDLHAIASRKRAPGRMANMAIGNNPKQQRLATAGGAAKLFALLHVKPAPNANLSQAELETKF